MGDFFLDSSAIVKKYVREEGTDWINRLTDPAAGHRLVIASVTGIEVVAALARRSQPAKSGISTTAIAEFRDDYINTFRVIQIDESIIRRGMDLAEKHKLRGYDAMQLSVAISVNAAYHAFRRTFVFVSADEELNVAARREGLTVEKPNALSGV